MYKMYIFILVLISGLSVHAGDQSFLTLDLYHQSRAMPLGDAMVRFPFNPGIQATWHTEHWGSGSLTGGTTLQAGYAQYDELFWSLHFGGGLEGTWNICAGFYTSYRLRLDYERIFTGRNNFELENGRYRQTTDTGRSYLRITPLDWSLGYQPGFLKSTGLIPALRFAWLLDLPMYGGKEAAIWNYTQLGISINYLIGE